LSYSRQDAANVERIATRLRQSRLDPWLDTWCVTPGHVWVDEAGAAIAGSSSCAVFIGPHDLGA
jgi:TIR domain-containing protein